MVLNGFDDFGAHLVRLPGPKGALGLSFSGGEMLRFCAAIFNSCLIGFR